jgi:hypothetical protein
MSSITRKQLWDIIGSCNKDQNNFKKYEVEPVCVQVYATLGVKPNPTIKQRVRNEINQYKKEVEKLRKAGKKQIVKPPTNNVVFEHDDMGMEVDKVDDEPPAAVAAATAAAEAASAAAARKPFSSLSSDWQRTRTDPLIAFLQAFVDNDKELASSSNAEPMTMRKLLGYLLRRTEYHNERRVSDIGVELQSDNIGSKKSITITEAICLKHELALPRSKMRVLKGFFNLKGLKFPNTTYLLHERKKLHPPILPSKVKQLQGVEVGFKNLVIHTTRSLLDVACLTESLDPAKVYTVSFKDGADGSGTHAVWKSKSMSGAGESIYQAALVPLSMESSSSDGTSSQIIWKNPAPNGAAWVRPHALYRASETDAMKLSLPEVDQQRDDLKQQEVTLSPLRQEQGTAVNVRFKIYDTMYDQKMKRNATGNRGADCIMCESRVADWTNEEQVLKGFDITRSYDKTMRIYEELADEEGCVIIEPKDWEVRKGLTVMPVSTSDHLTMCVTHSWINGANWLVKFLARVNQHIFQWQEKSDARGRHIRIGTEKVTKLLKDQFGLTINQVCQSGSKGGGSTDGNTGRRLFSAEAIPVIKMLTDEDAKTRSMQPDVLTLHRNLSVILGVVSSQGSVDLPAYQELVQETSLLLARKFSWSRLNWTLHPLLHHSADLIERNNCVSLGALSEEALESNNKYIRRFNETHARKTSPEHQLTDCMSRTLERSDPFIREQTSLFRRHHSTQKHNTKNIVKPEIVSMIDTILMR